ncbi:MAG: saccharopine dehydrogenase [Chlorobi bacterium]|nr:saccharopine dehydrogenase [Chlorobiota bacterium]
MKNILILGAGQSAPYLIRYLLDRSEKNDWRVTVADKNYELAKERVNGNPRGEAIDFDINDTYLRNKLIEKSDIVINMLSPTFQYMVALDCLEHKTHMISASYENNQIPSLHKDALMEDILILNEMGLDPGIDHMSAMHIINSIREKGGVISCFISYGSGIPAPEVQSNPMNYCITWNPRNVIMAGETGALYMENKKIKVLSHNHVFRRTWDVEVEGVGKLEAYPNRNSLIYQDIFKLHKVHTMIRGTLRYHGWSETWHQIIRLGIPNEHMRIPNLKNTTYEEFTRMFIPLQGSGSNIKSRVANYLNISPTGKIIQNFEWLGLFSDKKIGENLETPAKVLEKILREKMPLPEGQRDMVILQHQIEAEFPEQKKKKKIISRLVEYGEPNGMTAIAKTVGMPAAIAAELVLTGKLKIRGCRIPTHPDIYKPVLKELKKNGIKFVERTKTVK